MTTYKGFPGDAPVKNLPAKAGDPGSIPGLGRSPGEGNNSNLLQYLCLENSIDRGAWQATVHGVAESQAQLKQLSSHACITEVLCFTPGTNTTL